MRNTRTDSDILRVPDLQTEAFLLPSTFRERDNTRRIRHYKQALRRGIRLCLTPVQQEQIHLFYSKGLRKSEIARRQACTCSAVSKSLKAGEAALRSYIELYMDIFEALEQKFLLEQETT